MFIFAKNLKLKDMIDTHNDWSLNNPINQKELPELTELEGLQEYNYELKNKLKRAKIQLEKCIEVAEQFENEFILKQLKKIKL